MSNTLRIEVVEDEDPDYMEIDIVEPESDSDSEDEMEVIEIEKANEPNNVQGTKGRRINQKKKKYASAKKRRSSPRKPKRSVSPKKRKQSRKPRPGFSTAQPRPGCIRKSTKKYSNRPSPPYPANECCGRSMIGNDGNIYHSRPDKNGVCTWKK